MTVRRCQFCGRPRPITVGGAMFDNDYPAPAPWTDEQLDHARRAIRGLAENARKGFYSAIWGYVYRRASVAWYRGRP